MERHPPGPVLPCVAMQNAARGQFLVVGDGLAGTTLAAGLARGGRSVALLGPEGAGHGHTPGDWLPVDQGRARRQPPAVVLEPALPVDLILAGEHRIETSARIAVVDAPTLRREARRRARTAGVDLITAPPVTAALRERGGVAGVELADGTLREAPLTIDATGRGVMLDSLPGSVLPGGRYARDEREPVLTATVRVAPDRIQASWVGRAQLLMDLPRTGAYAWRATPRRGDRVYVALTPGPGHGRSAAEALLEHVLGPDLAPSVTATIRWQPCRRPLDSMVCEGMVIVGSAAAAVDSLLGLHLPVIEHGSRILCAALGSLDLGSRPGMADLFPASRQFLRALGPGLARRQAERRLLDLLAPEERESLVVSGVLGPGAFSGAVVGRPLLGVHALPRGLVGGLPHPLARRLLHCLRRCTALRAHYARYPVSHDLFALDSWQAKLEKI